MQQHSLELLCFLDLGAGSLSWTQDACDNFRSKTFEKVFQIDVLSDVDKVLSVVLKDPKTKEVVRAI